MRAHGNSLSLGWLEDTRAWESTVMLKIVRCGSQGVRVVLEEAQTSIALPAQPIAHHACLVAMVGGFVGCERPANGTRDEVGLRLARLTQGYVDSLDGPPDAASGVEWRFLRTAFQHRR